MENKPAFYGLLIGSLILGYFSQSLIGIHGDVSYLIYITRLVLNGQTYGKEIFETNPPMILYLYLPVVLLVKLTGINSIIILRLYILTLIGIFVSISNSLLKSIVGDPIVRMSTLIGILLALLFFPLNQFGQREHFLLIFLFPYILSIVYTLEGKKINKPLHFFIIFVAGIGFCIKPYFVFIFLLLNAFIAIKRKKMFDWVNPASLMIFCMMSLYLISTYFLFPGYLTIVLPLVNQFYFPGIKEPWVITFSDSLVIFCFAILVAYFILQKHDRYPILGGILAYSLIGAILSFLVTRTSWYSHITPAICLSVVLCFFFLGQLIPNIVHQKDTLFLRVVGSVFLVFLTASMLSPPLQYAYVAYSELMHGERVKALQAIEFIISKSSGTRSINCFSATTTMDCFPLVENINASYNSRYPFFWWTRGLYFFPNSIKYQLLTESVAEDLDQFKTRWIVINTFTPTLYFGNQFHFARYFSKNKHFRNAWKHYRLVKTVGVYELYQRL